MRRQIVHAMYNKNNLIWNHTKIINLLLTITDCICRHTCISDNQAVMIKTVEVVVLVSVKITVHNKYLIINYWVTISVTNTGITNIIHVIVSLVKKHWSLIYYKMHCNIITTLAANMLVIFFGCISSV